MQIILPQQLRNNNATLYILYLYISKSMLIKNLPLFPIPYWQPEFID